MGVNSEPCSPPNSRPTDVVTSRRITCPAVQSRSSPSTAGFAARQASHKSE